MSASKILLVVLTVALFGAGIFFILRGKPARRTAQAEGEKIALPVHPPAPPKPEEVQRKVEQIFKGAVMLASERDRYFFAGDFNGDGLQDLAVFIKPKPQGLTIVNSKFANWILEDPFVEPHIKPNQGLLRTALREQAVRAEQNDVLLAIIHGYGPEAWRSPMAQQTFLVRKAAGSGVYPEAFSEALLRPQTRLLMTGPKMDVIRETLADKPGFLYWTGAKYAWHS
ncbi:MAG TPA: FG-GAP repeat protein [Candidatus Dormibacteraeota bacterium]|nr:FG-GAP repeat protein [Candidatus Dormibacteraeota bacterium]